LDFVTNRPAPLAGNGRFHDEYGGEMKKVRESMEIVGGS
jgi:hypothetical protein